MLLDARVLDLTDEAGAMAAELLAELGADVVRVELDGPDQLRRTGPFLADHDGDVEAGLAHLVFGSGKRSVALTSADVDRLEALARAADIVLLPLAVPGAVRQVVARLEDRPQPALGIVEVVFRRDEPGAVATDLVAVAAGGLLTLCGDPADPPTWPGGDLAWKQTSLVMAEAAVALLIAARRFGRGGRIVVSVQEAVDLTTVQSANANLWHWQRTIPSRRNPLGGGTTYRSRDGRWTSFTVHPPVYRHFADWVAEVLGDDGLAGPEWESLSFIDANRPITQGYAARMCAALDRDELIAQGQARGLLVLPVQDLDEVAADVHLNARGAYVDVEVPQLGRSVRQCASPFLVDGQRPARRAAPRYGAHTDEVAAEWLEGPARTPVAPTGPPAANLEGADPHLPLAGVRIVDFCWAIAGPLGTRLLADLGADVIKIESEHRGDPIRYTGVQPADREPSWNTVGQYNDCNVNKRGVTLNLNTREGVDLARRLAATADVVTSNYTPDRLDRWGLGYDVLRVARPDLVMANLAVMGTAGPNKGWRSYGSGIVAMCGLAARSAAPGRVPSCIGTLHTDFTVPYYGAAFVMAALLRRDRTGQGAFLELSQYETAVRLLEVELVEALNGLAPGSGIGGRPDRRGPEGVYPCLDDRPADLSSGEIDGDRWVAVSCRDDADRRALATVVGADPEGDDLARRLAAWAAARDVWAATAALQAVGVPASPVETLRDLLFADKGAAAMFHPVDLGDGLSALVREEPILWDGERLPIRMRAPVWFEHTEEVLCGELGVPDEEFGQLIADGVLF